MHDGGTVTEILIAAVIATGSGAVAGYLGRRLLCSLRRGTTVRPPVCEAATALLWAWLAAAAAAGPLPWWWVPVPAAVAWFGVLLVVTDLRCRRLPDALTLPCYPVFALLIAVTSGFAGTGVATRAVVGALALGGLYLLMHLVAPAGLGAGDVKLSGSLGAVLGATGWAALLLAPLLAAVITLLLGGVARAVGDRRWRHGIPHGPGLLVAAWLLAAFPGAGLTVLS